MLAFLGGATGALASGGERIASVLGAAGNEVSRVLVERNFRARSMWLLVRGVSPRAGGCLMGRSNLPLIKMKLVHVVVMAFLLASCSGIIAGEPGFARGFLGLGLKTEEDWLTIGTVAPESPASRAGLRGGERVLKINGQTTEGKSLMKAMTWLAGAAGEKITFTLLRPEEADAQPFEVTLVRAEARPELRRPQAVLKRQWTRPPTREAGPVELDGNKIKSRVLPYPDFVSFFVRLPIAHAVSTGKDVKIAVIDATENQSAVTLVQNIVPGANVSAYVNDTNQTEAAEAIIAATNGGWHVVLVADPSKYTPAWVSDLTKQLTGKGKLVVLAADMSDDPTVVEAVNKAHKLGAFTVGRVNRQGTLMKGEGEGGSEPFNRKIRELEVDVFSTTSMFGEPPVTAAATAAGVAGLVLEKSPKAGPEEIRRAIVSGARKVWQAASVETGRLGGMRVDPVTTEYSPMNEAGIFRFRALDAAGALQVDTADPWFLNMLNCRKAWEVTKGDGVLALVTDQGFHLKHPALAARVQDTKCFGPMTFESPEMNFHGTDMSRILLAVAPGVRLVPALCSGTSYAAEGDLAGNIAKSFAAAAEMKVDIVSGSWSATFAGNAALLRTIRETADGGVLISWFHFPRAYPGVLRPGFTYSSGWATEDRLGFADRFLVDPPGFHPAEIEAGLSATAPQAAGIAALVKSINPKLTPPEIVKIIFKTATPIGGGVLVPDAWKAVTSAK